MFYSLSSMKIGGTSGSGMRRRNLFVFLVVCSFLQSGITDSDIDTRQHHVVRRTASRDVRQYGRHNRSHHHHHHQSHLRAEHDGIGRRSSVDLMQRDRQIPASGSSAVRIGLPIELLKPTERTQYGWNDTSSQRVSELHRDVSYADEPSGIRLALSPQQQRHALTSSSKQPAHDNRCDKVVFDSRYAVCCDGLIYSRATQFSSDIRCCGRVAYDVAYYACCGSRESSVLIRRGPTMPACCADRGPRSDRLDCPQVYPPSAGGRETDRAGSGSVCCKARSGSSDWQCCLRGEHCCQSDNEDSIIQVPGFRPACCSTASGLRSLLEIDLAAICCARTYEQIGLLPECCNADQLRPVCCSRPAPTQGGTMTKCCPATVGYCCGHSERLATSTRGYHAVMTTVRPPTRYQQRSHRIHADSTRARDDQYDSMTTTAQPTAGIRYHHSAAAAGRWKPMTAALPRVLADNYMYADSTVNNSVGIRQVASCCRNTPVSDCCEAAAAAAGGSAVSPGCCRTSCCRSSQFNATCCRNQLQFATATRRPIAHTDDSRNRYFQIDGNDQSEHHVSLQTHRSHVQSGPTPGSQIVNGQVHPHHDVIGTDASTYVLSETVASQLLPVVDDVTLDDQSSSLLASSTKYSYGDNRNGTSSRKSSHQPPEIEFITSLPKRHSPRKRAKTTTQPHNFSTRRHQPETQVRKIGRKTKKQLNDVVTTTASIDAITQTCAGTVFNADEYICCSGSLRMRIGVSSTCCGPVAYDRFLYRCCDDGVRMSCNESYHAQKSAWGVLV